MNKIELLAPAKDAATGIAAINCGADAVYIGASSFGARSAAANTLDEIKRLVDHAHLYYAKVYATLNTLLFDDEIESAQKLAFSLYEAGIDGLIIQDMGLLEIDMPPVPLIASTQTNNTTPEKVKFLEDMGFSRVILARELTLEQIAEIRKATTIELECFIHGALCVSQSGQCYMSYAAGGRSGNRGQCAQPCRKAYELSNSEGNTIEQEKYLLSLRDLNLSDYIGRLIDLGITSFKIEGRLKNIPYVANITGHYRTLLDEALAARNLKAASSGKTYLDFIPDPNKTFNRGYTNYGIEKNTGKYGSIDTPKAIGEPVAAVANTGLNFFELENDSAKLNNGDGICFFDEDGLLQGTVINKSQDGRIYPQKMDYIQAGIFIYRNYDHAFTKQLENTSAHRKISISLLLTETQDGIKLTAVDSDQTTAAAEIQAAKEAAKNPELAENNIRKQLSKFGNTIFECQDIKIDLTEMYFFPAATLNELRRNIATALLEARDASRPKTQRITAPNPDAKYSETDLTYLGNVLNEKAKEFYLKHGVENIEPAAESGIEMNGKLVMKTKYCLRRQLGLCNGSEQAPPLYITGSHQDKYRIEFTCKNCGMKIYKTD